MCTIASCLSSLGPEETVGPEEECQAVKVGLEFSIYMPLTDKG